MRKSVYMSVVALAVFAVAVLSGLVPGRDAAAQPGGVFINAVELDIAPGEMPKFLELMKENGAGSVKEPGCRMFHIAVLASNPNHVFLYEVYENEAALVAHRTTEHYKKYQAGAANMITSRNVRVFTPVAFNVKAN
jgi:(4S)-4-hydroxy-5-phosphonooxypentane-2,3-dione isomerase